jgi:hypothetical protein
VQGSSDCWLLAVSLLATSRFLIISSSFIAARWADHRKVTQISLKPDWAKHAAPFKRNDAMLDVMLTGVIMFPGSGIQENFADKGESTASRCGAGMHGIIRVFTSSVAWSLPPVQPRIRLRRGSQSDV